MPKMKSVNKTLNICVTVVFIAFASICTVKAQNDSSEIIHTTTEAQYRADLDSGSLYVREGKYTSALKCFFSVMDVATKANDKHLEGVAHSSIGATYFRLKNYDKALFHLDKAEELFINLNDNTGLSQVYYKKGIVYMQQPDVALKPKCLDYMHKVLQLPDNSIVGDELADVYNGFAGYYYQIQVLDSVEYYANKALEVYLKGNNPQPQAAMYINIAALLNSQKKHEKAIDYNKKGIEIAKAHHILAQLRQGYRNLSETYAYNHDYKNAYDAQKLYMQYKDSIITAEKQRAEVEFSKKYETKEKEEQLRIKEQKLKARNILLLIAIISLTLGIIVIAVIYRLLKIRKRQNTKLRELNQTKDKLFSIISHDLKLPAISQKLAINGFMPRIKEIDYPDLTEFFELLRDYSYNQVEMVQNLLYWARLQTKKIKYLPTNANIARIIDNEMKLYEITLKEKNIHLNLEIDDNCNAYFDEQMIGIVIRNILNNAIKFTRPKGNINIECKQNTETNKLGIAITDNGVGMDKHQVDAFYTTTKIVQVNSGTKGEKGTGLGLTLCKELLEQNNSKLIIESEKGKGTTMRFILPMKQSINNL